MEATALLTMLFYLVQIKSQEIGARPGALPD